MNSTYLKIISVLLVFIGELFCVYAETFGVKYSFLSNNFWKMILIITIGGIFLVTGYLFGYQVYKNLWVITVVSLTTLLIAEPLVIVVFFNEMPTRGALIGFVLGIVGLFVSIFVD